MSDLPTGSWRKWTDSRGEEWFVIFVPGGVLPDLSRVRVVKRDGRVMISRVGRCVAEVEGGRLYHASGGLAGGGQRHVRHGWT